MRKLLLAMLLTLLAASCAQTSAPVSEGDAALSVIMNRRSVRTFSGEKLSQDQIEVLLKAAMAAPTDGNVQPWEFVVVTDKDVVEAVFGQGHRADMYRNAGAVIIVCGHTTRLQIPRGEPDAAPVETPNGSWYEDCSCAAENLLLAAEAQGLGAVWMSAYPNEQKMTGIVEYFHLPTDVLPLAIIPVGYPAGDEQPKDKWAPEKVHYNKW